MRGKKGQLGDIKAQAMGLGIAIIVIGIVATAVLQTQNTVGGEGCVNASYTFNASTPALCSNAAGGYPDTPRTHTAAWNVTDQGQHGLTNMSSNFGLLGTVLIFSVILAAVMYMLYRKQS